MARQKARDLIPSGSTLLNLACSDSIHGAFGIGKVTNIIGDSSSGKSFFALTAVAHCANLRRFKDYDIIYDDAEAADEFDSEALFGPKFMDRVKPPEYDEDGEPKPSHTIEDFELNIHNAIDSGRPFIYVLDSLDAVTAEAEEDHRKKVIKARREGKDVSGSYGMEKAKAMSGIFRTLVRRIKKTRSALIIISQTRDNIDPMSFAKKTRSGGKALTFYATHEIWTAKLGSIWKTVAGEKYEIGVNGRAKVSKNKLTGRRLQINYMIYYSLGIDDLGANIDWLLKHGFIDKKKQTIELPSLDIKGTRENVILKIEKGGHQKEITNMMQEAWDGVREALTTNRTPVFAEL